jgi:cell division protein FtsZ
MTTVNEQSMHPALDSGTVIKVIGVGGAGGNAIQHMIKHRMTGVEFIAANTDEQALAQSTAHHVLQIGDSGLGAGMKPEVGRALAEASRPRIENALQGAHMVFIAAGMGGGTGTGAAPIIAEIAKKQGALTVAVVSKPFSHEGQKCLDVAELGLEELTKHVDSIIIILNEKLEEIHEDGTLLDWLAKADDVLMNAVAGIAEIINVPGHINVDFNDVKTVMGEQGKAMMGVATASGEGRAVKAAEEAIASPLLDGLDLSGARGVLVNISASRGLRGKEIKDVMTIVRSFAAPDAAIAQGVAYDDSMGDEIRVTVVATGLGRNKRAIHLVPTAPARAEHPHLRAASLGAPETARAQPSSAQHGPSNGAGMLNNTQASPTPGRPAVWRRDASRLPGGMEGTDYDVPTFMRNQNREPTQ